MTQVVDRPVDRQSGQGGPYPWWVILLVGILIGGAALYGVMQLFDGRLDSRQLVEDWMAAIEAQDLDALVLLYAEDVEWYDQALGDEFSGHHGVRRGWGIFDLLGFQVLDLQAVSMDESGAVVRWTLAGSSSPFTGQPWETTGVSVLTIVDGLISQEIVYYDSRDVQ